MYLPAKKSEPGINQARCFVYINTYLYFVLNLYMVLVMYSSPGRSVVLGHSG